MFLELRTKATIEEGIQWHEATWHGAGNEAVCYCPGDGTRYVIILTPLVGFSAEIRRNLGVGVEGEPVLVSLASDLGNVRGMVVDRGVFVDYNFVRKHLDTSLSSSIVLAEFIGWLLGGSAWSCDEARKHYASAT